MSDEQITNANLNDRVRVKLTERGRALLAEMEHPPTPDNDGWLHMPLWEVAQVFGHVMYPGCEVPISTEFYYPPRPNSSTD